MVAGHTATAVWLRDVGAAIAIAARKWFVARQHRRGALCLLEPSALWEVLPQVRLVDIHIVNDLVGGAWAAVHLANVREAEREQSF